LPQDVLLNKYVFRWRLKRNIDGKLHSVSDCSFHIIGQVIANTRLRWMLLLVFLQAEVGHNSCRRRELRVSWCSRCARCTSAK